MAPVELVDALATGSTRRKRRSDPKLIEVDGFPSLASRVRRDKMFPENFRSYLRPNVEDTSQEIGFEPGRRPTTEITSPRQYGPEYRKFSVTDPESQPVVVRKPDHLQVIRTMLAGRA